MPRITFVEHGGAEHLVDLPVGASLMEGAINNGLPGIDGDCGGLCACATCHVYIDDGWSETCDEAEELETSMLDLAIDVAAQSRLGCQIKVTDKHEGMVVRMPKSQY